MTQPRLDVYKRLCTEFYDLGKPQLGLTVVMAAAHLQRAGRFCAERGMSTPPRITAEVLP